MDVRMPHSIAVLCREVVNQKGSRVAGKAGLNEWRNMKALTTLLLISVLGPPAFTQPAKSRKEAMDDYCIYISKLVDTMDQQALGMEKLLPRLPATEQPAQAILISTLKTNNKQLRSDACLAKDLRSAMAAVKRDQSNPKLKAALAASAKAEANYYREKAQRKDEQ
jgi:hypothetical protein